MLSIKNNLENNNTNKNVTNNVNKCPPPWEVLALISYHLDPFTLAISSCVSKSWLSCFSSHFLWDPLCSSHFPSLSALQTTLPIPPRRLFAIGYTASRLRNRLPRKPNLSLDNLIFTLTLCIPSNNISKSAEQKQILKYGNCENSAAGIAAAGWISQQQQQGSSHHSHISESAGYILKYGNGENFVADAGWISQHQHQQESSHFLKSRFRNGNFGADLINQHQQSSRSLKTTGNSDVRMNMHVINIVRACKELKRDPQGTFRFEVDVEDDREYSIDEVEGVRVTWNVVDSNEWKAVFSMAEESGAKKGGFSSCGDGWFSEELPTPWCCSGAMSSGLVADLRVEMAEGAGAGARARAGRGSKMMRIKKVKLGVMCIINWRYLSVDDALSYLDHFLKV